MPTAGQALVHLLMLSCLLGLAVRGPFNGKRHAYVLAADWLGPPPHLERDTALAELARRYLRGHAPADDRDLAKWSGLPLRDARAGLAAVAEGEAAAASDAGALRPCLLDQWDPVLVGWASREPRSFRPYAWVGGRAVATWSARGGEVSSSRSPACGAPIGRRSTRTRRMWRGSWRDTEFQGNTGACCSFPRSAIYYARATSSTLVCGAAPRDRPGACGRAVAGALQPRVPAGVRRVAARYLLTRRLERAAALLRTTDRSIPDDLLRRRAPQRRLVHDQLRARLRRSPAAYRAAFPPASRGADPGLHPARLRPPATPHVSRRQPPTPP